MQQVARSIREKFKRDRLRNKIQSITPQQYSNSVRYYNDPVVPHQILKHQYRHLSPYAYNKKQQISLRQIYPISEALIYEPLRYNQLQAEYHRSKSLLEGNQFLKGYSEKEHQRRREEYFSRVKVIELAKKEQEQQRANQFKDIARGREKMRMSTVLPPLRPKKTRTSPNKFRYAGMAVLFICSLRKLLINHIETCQMMCDKNHRAYVRAALQSIQKYYYNKIQKQITQYMLLLQKKLKYPQIKTDTQIIDILLSLFTKINALPVPTSILTALKLICLSYSTFPLPFLFTQQLKRLPFLKEHQCTGPLTHQESMMLCACFIVVKLFCVNLFYRPWLVQDLFRKHHEKYIDVRHKYPELKRTINHMGSLPYFIVIDSFMVDCPVLHSNSQIKQLAQQGIIYTVPFMQVLPKETPQGDPLVIDSSDSDQEQKQEIGQMLSGRTEKETQVVSELVDGVNLIAGQNRGFYRRMRESHQKQMNDLEEIITEWVTKVTLSVLDLSTQEKRKRVRQSLA